jgi:hypothetical protein
MWMNTRGQMGPIGEDFIYYTFAFIIIAFILLLAVITFADNEARYFLLDGFRTGQAYADKAAVELAVNYPGDESDKTFRVLDIKKVQTKLSSGCDGICENCGVCVRNRRTGVNISCGVSLCGNPDIDPANIATTVRLPVALKMSDKEFHPAVLEVSIIR